MNWYVKRTGQALFTLWAVVTLAFFLARQMPGTALERYVDRVIQNTGQGRDPEQVRNAVREQLMFHPDDSFLEAYTVYMSNLLTGNLGYSIEAGENLNKTMADAVPWTLFVMTIATFGLFSISLALGAIMAYKEGSIFDMSNTLVGIVTTSVPYYVAAIFLILYVGFNDGFLFEHIPRRDRLPHTTSPGFTLDFVISAFSHALLPALSYIITAYGLLALSMRGNSIQVLGEDYVRVAQLRGLPERRIALRYVGRNAILPLYTSLLISVGFMMGASVILEQIFQYQGVGFWMWRAIDNMDVTLMMAVFLMITISIVIATFFADLSYGFLDPRIKSGDEGEAY